MNSAHHLLISILLLHFLSDSSIFNFLLDIFIILFDMRKCLSHSFFINHVYSTVVFFLKSSTFIILICAHFNIIVALTTTWCNIYVVVITDWRIAHVHIDHRIISYTLVSNACLRWSHHTIWVVFRYCTNLVALTKIVWGVIHIFEI